MLSPNSSSLVVLESAEEVAEEAARFIAAQARLAIKQRGRFVMAVSGGRTQVRASLIL